MLQGLSQAEHIVHSIWYLDDVVGVDVELFMVGDSEEVMLVASDRGVRANRSRRVVLRKSAISGKRIGHKIVCEVQGK